MSDSTTYRAVTFRLHPGSRARHVEIARTAGACRHVWNHFLAKNRREYALWKASHDFGGPACHGLERPPVTFQSLGVQFTQLRKATPWLAELPYLPVRYVLKYQADAWKRAFERGGYPKFKSRRGNDSFTIPQDVRIVGGRLRIPRIGWVKLSRRGGNPHEGCKPVKAVVKRVLGKWHCVVVYETDIGIEDNGKAVGIDMNCGQVASSDGEIHRMPEMRRLQARKRRYERMMARRRKGSGRRALARHRRARTLRKIATIRSDWHHHVSRSVADRYGTAAIEDLRTKSMTRSARGTTDKPGKRVRQKAGLNREILNTGWGRLRQMLQYKCARVIAVPPMYTSRTCWACGAVDAASRRSQSEFRCARCGHEDNADVNAALNILALGTGAAGRGGGGVARPVKRQTVSGRVAA